VIHLIFSLKEFIGHTLYIFAGRCRIHDEYRSKKIWCQQKKPAIKNILLGCGLVFYMIRRPKRPYNQIIYKTEEQCNKKNPIIFRSEMGVVY
jgi:hypothetical protein